MPIMRFVHVTIATFVAVAAASVMASAQREEKPSKEIEARRPKMTLRAQPQVVIAPARVTLTTELTGGADDFEEYYCPTVEWEWGDDTSSESTTDCEPYQSGQSQIKRRYTVQHQFRRPGNYKVYFHLKLKDRILGSATTNIQVQPGVGAF